MNVVFQDLETVGEVSAQAFQIYQAGPVTALVAMQNVGVNPIVYVFQQMVSGTWTDIGVLGTPFNDTLEADAAVDVAIAVPSNQVRLMASASGGSTLTFNSLQQMARASGGAIPILNF